MAQLDIKNIIYPLDGRDKEEFYHLLINLEDDNLAFDKSYKIRIDIQMIKASLMVKFARELLTLNPSSKVILTTDFKSVNEFLAMNLQEFNPVRYVGSNKELHQSVSKFQEPNTETRVFILSSNNSHGIMLDDNTGNFPRFMIQMGDHNISEQLMGRIIRYTTVGTATFLFF